MKTKIKNFEVELSGSMIVIRKDDQALKAFEVPVLHAVERYESTCEKLKSYVLSSSLATS